jgi:hypothetical protein
MGGKPRKKPESKPQGPPWSARVELNTRTIQVEEGEDASEGRWRYRGVDTQILGDVKVFRMPYEKYRADPCDFLELGKDVFVLIEEYSTGDTFGRTEAYFEYKDVFATYEDAHKAMLKTKPTTGYFDRHKEFHIKRVMVEHPPLSWL